MINTNFSRRNLLFGAASATALQALPHAAFAEDDDPKPHPETAEQKRRLAWWHDAKFGMFIHFGLYSAHARHEWAMEDEAIPVKEYEKFTDIFKPKPGSARAWAKLAKSTGMKYMVMTTKHHEGFCNWDTKLTNYNAMQLGPKRDLVREYVEAAREEGLRVGFYYSLMDWHHPDGARCKHDEAARRRFVDYPHGLIRELLTNYGAIDILWYDVAWPLDAQGWESTRMNQMVFELQPNIIVNNRNRLPGDFSTPEQKIVAEEGGRAWESCMTLNGSWGYQRADDSWKSAKTVVRNLIDCVRDGGNYLLNIGPMADGSVPEPSVRVLNEVGAWMRTHGDTIYRSGLCDPRRSNYASFTREGNTLYMHVHYWPGSDVSIGGLQARALSAKLLKTGKAVKFAQDAYRLHLTDLPKDAPDSPVTTIAIVCDKVPTQDNLFVRNERPRAGVGV